MLCSVCEASVTQMIKVMSLKDYVEKKKKECNYWLVLRFSVEISVTEGVMVTSMKNYDNVYR